MSFLEEGVIHTYIFSKFAYVWVHNRSNMPMFCLKKIISQPWVVQKSQFLEEMTLTQYILMSLIKKSNNKLIKLIK